GSGLFRATVKNGTWQLKQFKHNESDNTTLVNDFINSIYEDHAGSMWIGTEGGLVLFDRRTEKFSLSIPEDGLTNNVIVSMLEDDDGKLWLAHWNGLSVFDPTGKRNIVNYNQHDRIQGGFYYNNVCFKNDDGLLFFGGSNGFNIIDSKTIDQNPILPKIVVEDFQIFNRTVPFGEPFNGRVILDKAFDEMEKIVLKYYENSISFEFSALDFAAPEKIRYAYKLEGFDANWNYTNSSRRYANYTNLKQGDYRLLVKATNTEGIWNEKITRVGIEILPPWWKTIWAGIAYFIIFVIALYVFRRLVLMRVNFMHELKVERMQRDNLEKLNKAKLQFFTNVSHEFRTPLTLILGPAQNLLDSFEGGKAVRDQILSINNNAQRLLRLVNQLLDFRKTESGNMKLEVAEGNMVKFIKEIKLSFDPLAEQMKIDFSISSSSNIIKAWFDRDQFEKIMFNLLSNAFKNTPGGGNISIRINENKESLTIIVEDNGKGIKVEHFESIFQSFFSYDEEHHHTGTGIGLALTKSLIEMHHGEIRVESEEHVYTRFILTMPLGNKHFDQSELIHEIKDIELAENYQMLASERAFNGSSDISTNHDGIEVLPKVLIVEDNAEVRAYIKSIFYGKYKILEAEEGKEGLNVVLEEIPDLVISDVMMPIMDGITLCKEIKSNMKTSHIPVILLTARTSLIFKVEGLEMGADDYVTKPFNPKVLELKVRNIMRTHEVMRNLFRDNKLLTIEPKRVTLNSSDERFVQQALESIEKNMSNAEYSVEDLGVDVGMSRMQLYRKLKALTGQSANEFIRTIRLKRAAQLLEQNQLTIAEVTYEVGFVDLQYFRECFKKLFSLTPSEYVQKKSGTEVKDADTV
ncbi:MAG TPA: response regulator, partial [Cyclobacteriaceae bacterium]